MPSSASQRSVRSDAVANRERLLAEAEVYFAERGLDASLHELVARAGFGIGTLYRHFPTHGDLIRALHDRQVERIDLVVEQLENAESGWDALVGYIDGALAVFRELPAAAAVGERMSRTDPTSVLGARWAAALTPHVERAKAEGRLRADVDGDDVALIPFLLAGAVRLPESARERQRAIILDGLRG